MLKYTIVDSKTDATVILQGDLDIEGTEIMNDELLPNLLSYKVVTISMVEVPFVDSSGVGLLINMVNALKDNSISIKISDVTADVFEVFELLQLPEIVGHEVFS